MLVRLSLNGDDPAAWLALSQSIRDWEPALDIWLDRLVPRIYEPDGTFYAVCLGTTRLTTDRRAVDVHRGDLIIVPRSVAIDMETPVDLLCLKHDGMAPYHFRERFIQIWGFERISAEDAIAPERTAEHRVEYRVIDLEPGFPYSEADGLDFRVAFVLTGECHIEASDSEDYGNLATDGIVVISPESSFALNGTGRLGVLRIPNEMMHDFRLGERHLAKPPTPDFPAPPP